MTKKILIIAAHPDDEVLGCGGTIARISGEGNDVFVMILGEGVTSRDDKRDLENRQKDLKLLQNSIKNANKIIGVNDLFLYNFPDNRFDSVDLLDIIKVVENVKIQIKPDIIFTHSKNDLNIDHRITYKAVITATRPISNETVKEIYSFEILSSTEWNYPFRFSPNYYVNIENYIDKKIEAMKEYKSELRDFPHPRSLEGIKVKASNRGMEVGMKYAEAFEVVRIIR